MSSHSPRDSMLLYLLPPLVPSLKIFYVCLLLSLSTVAIRDNSPCAARHQTSYFSSILLHGSSPKTSFLRSTYHFTEPVAYTFLSEFLHLVSYLSNHILFPICVLYSRYASLFPAPRIFLFPCFYSCGSRVPSTLYFPLGST